MCVDLHGGGRSLVACELLHDAGMDAVCRCQAQERVAQLMQRPAFLAMARLPYAKRIRSGPLACGIAGDWHIARNVIPAVFVLDVSRWRLVPLGVTLDQLVGAYFKRVETMVTLRTLRASMTFSGMERMR